ncbi:VolA/Pla-1 family phospholipase [Aliagarivorans marinus]|uniref:VolA/Pla-1 family phospholipase n=1 Tax=Aliagarivorans marinus TaxID=561965 RepID=UPI0004266806|nr:VolA/Pla-1 family phospholipase [Aliagarivorans marinus]
MSFTTKAAGSLAIALSLGLSGCGGSDSPFDFEDDTTPVAPPSAKISFDPLAGVVSTPNNLLFSGSLDGTVNLPDEAALTMAAQYQDVSVVLGALDGWQLSVPISIPLAYGEHDADYDELTHSALDETTFPAGVMLYKARVSGFADDCSDVTENGGSFSAGQTCRIDEALNYGEDFVASFSGGDLVIVPLKPFDAASSYLIALNADLMDLAGASVHASEAYEELATASLAELSGTALSIASLIQWDNGLLAAEGVSDVIYTATFTTQSSNAVLDSVAQVYDGMAAVSALTMPALTATGLTAADIATTYLGASTPSMAASMYYQTTLSVPYYLSDLAAPTVTDVNGWAQAQSDSPVAVLQLLSGNADFADLASATGFAAQATMQGFDPTAVLIAAGSGDTATAAALLAASGLTGLTYMNESGDSVPVDFARHLTAYNPVPEVKSTASLTVDVYLPDTSILTSLTMPAGGWPVVIFQHGISTIKELTSAIAPAYNAAGFAVVAIDLPYHGSRGIDVDMDGVDEFNASTTFSAVPAWANADDLVFMNLGSTLSIRDNVRQAGADILALRAALSASGIAQLDGSNVHLAGQSLGAMVAIPAVATANNYTASFGTDFSFTSAGFSVPGQAAAGVIVNSATFGPEIQAGLKENEGYLTLVANGLGFTGDDALTQFEAYREANPEAAEFLIEANFPAFLSVFSGVVQSVIDGADPLAHASRITSPVLLHEVVGDGADSLSDQTIPNNVEGQPLVGTDPLIANFGLATTEVTAAGSHAVRFSKGIHGSLISTAGGIDVTTEMQTQMATFAATGGATVLISDSSVIAP